MNHYAHGTFFSKSGRHYWFAENLIKEGHKPTIFCSSTRHNSEQVVRVNNGKYKVKKTNEIPYVFVKTTHYKGNGIKRIRNMWSFYRELFSVTKSYAKFQGKPDVILASSVHPLTLIAGIKIAKKFGVPCICEIRDLWPESIVAYMDLNKNSVLAKTLYSGERWIYKRADKLIFTMEGGKDYIVDKGWDFSNGGPVDLSKIHHINNGVNLELFNYNKKNFIIKDDDINNEFFKVVYSGSIRKANNVKKIVRTAEYIEKLGFDEIKFLIYGDGAERRKLEEYCNQHNLKNIKFKGRIDKSEVPYVLSNSNLNILHFDQNNLKKYGASLNKLFEYFASGKPTISDCEFGYDLIKKYQAGIVVDNASIKQLAEEIIKFYKMPSEEYNVYCKNAIKAATDYDFKILTKRLLNIINN